MTSRVRGPDAAREDRHARLRRPGRDQQVRQARRSLDALRDVRKQYQRNHQLFDDAGRRPARCTARSRRSSTTRARTASTGRSIDDLVEKTGAAGFASEFEPRADQRLPDASARHPAEPRPLPRRSPRVQPTATTRGSTRAGDLALSSQVLFQLALRRDRRGKTDAPRTIVTRSPSSDRDPTAPSRGRSAELDPSCRRSCSTRAPGSLARRRWSATGRTKYQLRGPRGRDRVEAGPLHRVPVAHADPQGRAAPLRGWGDVLRWLLRRTCPARVPVHRRRLPVQAAGRGPDAHVRRRGRPRADQPPLPLRVARACRRSGCRRPSTR